MVETTFQEIGHAALEFFRKNYPAAEYGLYAIRHGNKKLLRSRLLGTSDLAKELDEVAL